MGETDSACPLQSCMHAGGPYVALLLQMNILCMVKAELSAVNVCACRGISVMEDEGQVSDHTSGISATDGTWHHIAVTWQSSDGAAKLYDNGRKVSPWLLCHSPSPSPWGLTFVWSKLSPAMGLCALCWHCIAQWKMLWQGKAKMSLTFHLLLEVASATYMPVNKEPGELLVPQGPVGLPG